VLLFVLALGVRLPSLMEVPGFTDEGIDVLIGLDALHARWPLVDAEPYIGSLFNYLLAAGFLVLGQESHVPRFTVTLLGALTVVLTYCLALRLAGPTAALLTAGLMATSGVHIVNGHVAWSNCTSPFFTTAATLALVEAVARGNGRLLVLAGALYGLALQSHASVILLGPALLLHLVTGRHAATAQAGRLIRTRWVPLAALAALLACSNLLVFNVLHPGAWESATRGRAYAYVDNPTLEIYLHNLEGLATSLLRMGASSFVGGPSFGAQATAPANLPYLLLALTGAAYAVWRRQWLPLAVVLSAMLLMPYLNKYYQFPIGLRYLGYVLPFLYLIMAEPVARAIELVRGRSPGWTLALVTGCLLLVGMPVPRLLSYYDEYLVLGATNPTILALHDEVGEQYRAGRITEVLLDPQLDGVFTAPGGRGLRVFEYLFMVSGVPYRTVWMAPEELERATASAGRPVGLIVSTGSRERLGGSFDLVPFDVPDRPHLHRDGYWGYTMNGSDPAERDHLAEDAP
jgi:4-amino-4-deoxy-L-arabinose transferase-like glycosyltransferase